VPCCLASSGACETLRGAKACYCQDSCATRWLCSRVCAATCPAHGCLQAYLLNAGEHKSPDVMAINPRGQVPAFKDGDAIVNESYGIMVYLDKAYPDPALMPKAGKECAEAWQRFAECNGLWLAIQPLFMTRMTKPDYDKVCSCWLLRRAVRYTASRSLWNAMNLLHPLDSNWPPSQSADCQQHSEDNTSLRLAVRFRVCARHASSFCSSRAPASPERWLSCNPWLLNAGALCSRRGESKEGAGCLGWPPVR
jgi:Glutathione S-transferase, N-terminal domain